MLLLFFYPEKRAVLYWQESNPPTQKSRVSISSLPPLVSVYRQTSWLTFNTTAFFSRFAMGIEFREGSLLISPKNMHIAKKGMDFEVRSSSAHILTGIHKC